jgi:hypothetical protein
MDGSVQLSETDRKRLLEAYRGSGAARIARRAHVMLLLGDGWSYRDIMTGLFCSSELVSEAVRDDRAGGVAAVLRETEDRPATIPHWCLRGWPRLIASIYRGDEVIGGSNGDSCRPLVALRLRSLKRQPRSPRRTEIACVPRTRNPLRSARRHGRHGRGTPALVADSAFVCHGCVSRASASPDADSLNRSNRPEHWQPKPAVNRIQHKSV